MDAHSMLCFPVCTSRRSCILLIFTRNKRREIEEGFLIRPASGSLSFLYRSSPGSLYWPMVTFSSVADIDWPWLNGSSSIENCSIVSFTKCGGPWLERLVRSTWYFNVRRLAVHSTPYSPPATIPPIIWRSHQTPQILFPTFLNAMTTPQSSPRDSPSKKLM